MDGAASTALVLRPDDRAACRAWIAHHSKSFFLSSWLLPERVRQASWALYAFCRRADDAVDEGAGGAAASRRVDALRRRLDSVYHGKGQDDPIDRAFSLIVERYAIPRGLPEELLRGMEMDLGEVMYETSEELLHYCFRVASTVGMMMTLVMGVRDPSGGRATAAWTRVAYRRACDLGVAMQLTNIARDVGEDARRGRVYLPRDLCAEAGLEPRAILGLTEATPALRLAVERLLELAERHYRSADLGVPLLPRGCRVAIAASRRIYSAIGRRVAANGYDAVTRRAYVSLGGKLWLALGALGAPLGSVPVDSLNIAGPADALVDRWLAEAGVST